MQGTLGCYFRVLTRADLYTVTVCHNMSIFNEIMRSISMLDILFHLLNWALPTLTLTAQSVVLLGSILYGNTPSRMVLQSTLITQLLRVLLPC